MRSMTHRQKENHLTRVEARRFFHFVNAEFLTGPERLIYLWIKDDIDYKGAA